MEVKATAFCCPDRGRLATTSPGGRQPLNRDGFGVGWYAPGQSDEPAVFRSITPAWNNRNLHALSRVVASPCILAHVRAATHSSAVNEANCHTASTSSRW